MQRLLRTLHVKLRTRIDEGKKMQNYRTNAKVETGDRNGENERVDTTSTLHLADD